MIGLIFGDTDFPKEILRTVKKRKIKYLIIDLSKSKKFKQDRKSYSVSIGQFGKIINILKENNCKKVLFAGKVNKPNFSKLKLDFKGIYYIPRIIKASKLGDAAILKEIIKILAQNNIKTETRNLKSKPLTASELKEYGAIIIDPPRSGAQLQFLNIAESKVETVVSISCDLDSFVRDSKILIENNYILKWVQPIDQFLYSSHLEIVGFFQLNETNEC